MRIDKKKNISKVAKVVLNEPLLTRDEIAIKAGVGQGTASRALEELDEIGRKDNRIVGLLDGDFEIMNLIQAEKKRRLTTEADKVNNNDIDKWEQTAVKRTALFGGDKSDPDREVVIVI